MEKWSNVHKKSAAVIPFGIAVTRTLFTATVKKLCSQFLSQLTHLEASMV